VDLRRAPRRLRHCHPHGERHPPAVARRARPDLSRGDTGRDVAGGAERELVGIGAFDLAGRATLGPALGPHGPGGAARSVTSRVLQPIRCAVRDPEPVAVFGAEQLQLAVSVAVAVCLAVGFPVPVAYPFGDQLLPDPLPLAYDYPAIHATANHATAHATAHDPATYHGATTHDATADHGAAYDAATYHGAAYDTAAVFVDAFGDARLGVGALFIVWRALFGSHGRWRLTATGGWLSSG
jgi:hypothetical protein